VGKVTARRENQRQSHGTHLGVQQVSYQERHRQKTTCKTCGKSQKLTLTQEDTAPKMRAGGGEPQ